MKFFLETYYSAFLPLAVPAFILHESLIALLCKTILKVEDIGAFEPKKSFVRTK
jgi:hypothetical protein